MSENIASVKDVIIYKVQTLAAGGGRITLDFDSRQWLEVMPLLIFADTPGALLNVDFSRIELDKDEESYGL